MSWTEQITIVVHGLVITSIILVKFDDISYSFWMTIKALVDFALLADAGFGHTLERSVAFFYSVQKSCPETSKTMKILKNLQVPQTWKGCMPFCVPPEAFIWS